MSGRVRVENATRGAELGSTVAVADRWWARLKGLLGAPQLGPGEGLLLTPCRAVHMLGMRWPLDVAFADAELRVVALYPALPPRARTAWHREAVHALELPPGTLQLTGTRVGDRLRMAAHGS